MGRPLTRLLGLVCAAVIGTLACGEGPTPPEPLPGDLLVTLVSPSGAERAAVFETADDGLVEAAGAYLRTHLVLSAEPSNSAFYRLVVRNTAVPGQGQLYGGPNEVRSFSRRGLMVSDIVLAEGEGGNWQRGNVQLALRPSHQFRVGEPLTLFYEIYNLPSGAPYRTELTIEPSGTRGVWSRLKGLLGLEHLPPGLTLCFEGEAGPLEGPGQQELRRITAPLLPGSYTLRVRITNPEWDESATRETAFNVVE